MGRNKNIKTSTTTATTNNGGGSNNSTPVKIPKEAKLQAKRLKAGDKYKTSKLTKSKLKKSKLEVQNNTEALLKFREKFITNLSNCIHQFEQDCLQ
jgi:virulence-associated protein VagC